MYVDSSTNKRGKRTTTIHGLDDLQVLCLIEALGETTANGVAAQVARATLDALEREMNIPQPDYSPQKQD